VANIQVKNYEHWNHSFPNWDHPFKGTYVKNKAHYYELCRKYNMVPYELAGDLARKYKEQSVQAKYEPAPEIRDFITYVESKTDSKGRCRLDDRAIQFMIDHDIVQDQDLVTQKLERCEVPYAV